MRRLFIAAQLLLVVVIAAGIAYSLFKPVEKPDYDRDNWRSWRGFSVLSYQGISKNSGSGLVSQEQLREHLKALKEAGFHTITPADAAAFLEGKSPLPENALLLLFEGGRKDTLLYATSILQANRFFGVMCLPTRVTEERGAFYLNPGDVRKLSESPNWRLGSMGHRAIDTIPVDAAGTKGHFLTGRVWREKGSEDNGAFVERVEKDYQKAAETLKAAVGDNVETYLYPFSDPGMRNTSGALAREINNKAVRKHHRIAFTRSDDAYNAQGSDPYDMGRIRVSAKWDGPMLLRQLQRYTPREELGPDRMDPADWTFAGMDAPPVDNFELDSGASAWARGTDGWADFEIESKLRFTEHATAFLYGRYRGPGSYVRLSISGKGIRVQERIGNTMQTLAWYESKLSSTKEHLLKLRVKGNRVWAGLEGTFIAGPVPLTMGTARGRIGVGAQDSSVQFSRLRARQIASYFVMADSFGSLPQTTRDEMGVMVPLWFGHGAGAGPSADQRREFLIAASAGVMTVPMVDAPRRVEKGDIDALVARVHTSLGNPLIKPLVRYVALRNPDARLAEAIHSKGYRIIRVLTASEATALPLPGQVPDSEDRILIIGNEEDTLDALKKLLRSVPGNRLIATVSTTAARDMGITMMISPSGPKR